MDESSPDNERASPEAPKVSATLSNTPFAPNNILTNIFTPQGRQQASYGQVQVSVGATTLPFIPPHLLVEYENAYPGIGARLIDWTEKQQNHRQDLEKQRASGSETRQNRSQVGSALVAVGGIVTAGFVGIYGSAAAASIIAIVSVGGPVAAVVLASRFGQGRPTAPQLPTIPKANEEPAPSVDDSGPPR